MDFDLLHNLIVQQEVASNRLNCLHLRNAMEIMDDQDPDTFKSESRMLCVCVCVLRGERV